MAEKWVAQDSQSDVSGLTMAAQLLTQVVEMGPRPLEEAGHQKSQGPNEMVTCFDLFFCSNGIIK